jgi:hypothetical protein
MVPGTVTLTTLTKKAPYALVCPMKYSKLRGQKPGKILPLKGLGMISQMGNRCNMPK